MSLFYSLRGVSYQYPKGDFALSDLSFSVSGGERIWLCGQNGSGKTTLGKLLAGILTPQSGDLLLEGTPLSQMTLGAVGKRVGYLFQDPSRQLFASTVLEELTFVPVLSGTPQKKAEEAAQEVLALLDLLPLADRPSLQLSQGEKQRLALGSLLMNEPDFLILDEPTTGLDKRRLEILSGILGGLAAEGLGMVLITHDPAFAALHTTRRILLEEGRVVLDDVLF